MAVVILKVSHSYSSLNVDLNLIRLVAARDHGGAPAPRSLLGRQPGQGMPRMAPIREESAVGSSLSERNMNQLNKNFGEMNVNADVNIDINNNDQGASRSLVHSSSNMQVAQQEQFAQQPASAEESIRQNRFVTLSYSNVPPRLLTELCNVFQVRGNKVRGWLDEGLIRTDLQKWKEGVFPHDIELLTPQLANKDIEKWDNFVRGYNSDRELRKAIGSCGRSYPEFERDFNRARPSRTAFVPAVMPGCEWYHHRCAACFFRGHYCGHPVIRRGSGHHAVIRGRRR